MLLIGSSVIIGEGLTADWQVGAQMPDVHPNHISGYLSVFKGNILSIIHF